jgi:hypothetical protein
MTRLTEKAGRAVSIAGINCSYFKTLATSASDSARVVTRQVSQLVDARLNSEGATESSWPYSTLSGTSRRAVKDHGRFWRTPADFGAAAIPSGYRGTCPVPARHAAYVLVTRKRHRPDDPTPAGFLFRRMDTSKPRTPGVTLLLRRPPLIVSPPRASFTSVATPRACTMRTDEEPVATGPHCW